MRAIGFCQGQRGDLIISTVAARAFKQRYPDAHLTLGVNQRYTDMIPLFYQHPYFDDFHVYEEYDNWPGRRDQLYLLSSGYNAVYPAMPKRHNEATWWQTEHQAQNICSVYGLIPPQDIQCILTPWFRPYGQDMRDYVAFNYIGAFYAGYPNAKSYSPERAAEIVRIVRGLGYKVIVLGDPNEPLLEGTERRPLTYVESVKTMLSCRAFIGIDSGLTWAASAYSFPTLACYSDAYYSPAHISNIQPRNPNSRYLSAPNVNEISVDAIVGAVREILS